MDNEIEKVKKLGEIVNGGGYVYIRTDIKYYTWDGKTFYDTETPVYQFQHSHPKSEREKAKRELAKYTRSLDDEVRILARQEYGPSDLELLKAFVVQWPLTSAIVIGIPPLVVFIKLAEHALSLPAWRY